jgi:hypothetical protein
MLDPVLCLTLYHVNAGAAGWLEFTVKVEPFGPEEYEMPTRDTLNLLNPTVGVHVYDVPVAGWCEVNSDSAKADVVCIVELGNWIPVLTNDVDIFPSNYAYSLT